MISSEFTAKTVDNIFKLIPGNIVDLKYNGQKIKVDAIVNAAKPTLMGGGGVDGAIHGKMDDLLKNSSPAGGNMSFNDQIKKELDGTTDSPNSKIRCKPGNAVITSGNDGLAKYIIHAVGSKYDGGSECMKVLKHCYESIMARVFETADIKSVAIPVISSGNYNCPFNLALRIAITTIGNCLIREKNRNYDNFSRLENVYLVIFEQKYHLEAKSIYERFEKQLKAEQHMVYSGPWEKQKAYCIEILKNDSSKRGYFTVTKMFRLFLAAVRFLFPITMLLNKIAGNYGWKRRREITEVDTVLKTFVPLIAIMVIQGLESIGEGWLENNTGILYVMCGVVAYFMIDTITCLMALIFLTDLYGPSANRLRTIILLIFNYVEMLFGIALFYYVYFWNNITIWKALDYSIIGNTAGIQGNMSVMLRIIMYSKTGIDFFFVVMTFAFFVSHLRHRDFLEE